ncbi:MAG: UDP-3-O-(3-hydroxymyristoyl)glucosamine N-acyltransferase [Acidiferrobacterales bacterium]
MTVRLVDLARRFGGELRGNPEVEIDGVATLERAGARDIGYAEGARYYDSLSRTAAGAVILGRELAARFPGNAIIVDNPRLCFAKIALLMHPRAQFEPGIHATAIIEDGATVASTAWIGPGSVIEHGASIGHDAFVGPLCYVGRGAAIGDNSWLMAHVVIGADCVVGRNCTVQPGAIVGSDGFGYVQEEMRWVKFPQLGRVKIGDDVEIGANTAIDRGALDDTVIADGVKLDNLIQVGHNVTIGEHTAVAACAGIAGSSRVGKGCAIGGGVGIVDHVEIADDVRITATSVVTGSLKKAGTYSSSLKAVPIERWRRNVVRLSQLEEMAQQLRRLEQEIRRLSEGRKT